MFYQSSDNQLFRIMLFLSILSPAPDAKTNHDIPQRQGDFHDLPSAFYPRTVLYTASDLTAVVALTNSPNRCWHGSGIQYVGRCDTAFAHSKCWNRFGATQTNLAPLKTFGRAVFRNGPLLQNKPSRIIIVPAGSIAIGFILDSLARESSLLDASCAARAA